MNAIPKLAIPAVALPGTRIETVTITAPTIRRETVARLLGYADADYFARHIPPGFPPKLPGINAWSTACVLRWIDTNGAAYLPPAEAEAVPPPANSLERRYGREARQ